MVPIAQSILATFITLVIIAVWRACWTHWLINHWLKLACRHISDISGNWVAEYSGDGWRRREEISLTQFGWKIKGTINYCYQTDGEPPHSNNFKFEGIFRNEILSAFYWVDDRKRRGCGSFTLQLNRDGTSMEGYAAIYDSDESKISSEKYHWKKQG